MHKWRQWFDWAEAHPKVWLDGVRIYLGIGLFVRGVLLFTSSHQGYITAVLGQLGDSWLITVALLHYIALAHLVGGLMLVFGVLTRIAAAVQLPILAGAVFVVHRHEGLLAAGQSLEFAALVLFLLSVIAIAGPGPVSVDGEARVASAPPAPPALPTELH
jgi:uncharacterized membrane protein YphA (DoxX/SURF4 family)